MQPASPPFPPIPCPPSSMYCPFFPALVTAHLGKDEGEVVAKVGDVLAVLELRKDGGLVGARLLVVRQQRADLLHALLVRLPHLRAHADLPAPPGSPPPLLLLLHRRHGRCVCH